MRVRDEAQAVVLFVHGFGGGMETWGQFPEFLAADPRVQSWDIFLIGYSSSLRVDIPRLWTADPRLEMLSLSLRTALDVPPLRKYRRVALIAHSMGGLVAQHAMLDDETARKISHLVLFGTPSSGLLKAIIGALLKRQARDMVAGSRFIRRLRSAWSERYDAHRPFVLRVVAGERDEFVPSASSLDAFDEEVQRAVPGNHSEIVKPEKPSDRSVQLVVDALCGGMLPPTAIDGALLAIERREYWEAVEALMPQVNEIDDNALVQLALALEALGRGEEALDMLEDQFKKRGRPSTDAVGVLAGRLKRRWLVDRRSADWARARELYAEGLQVADPQNAAESPSETAATQLDPDQAMYHAINIVFLDAMQAPPLSNPVPHVLRSAERAIWYAERSAENHWRFATEGDANQVLRKLDVSCERYTKARMLAGRQRDIASMYSQALRLAEHLHGGSGVNLVQRAFEVTSPSY